MYPIKCEDWNAYRNCALDLGLNAAVLAISRRLFPAGFDVADNAPQTYEGLLMHLDAGNRMVVFSGGSEHTIFGDREVNYAFRAWHDWCHWRGRFDLSHQGERGVCAMQEQHLVTLYGDCARTEEWRRILRAEIIGQRDHFDVHGRFPDDQRAFVENYLANKMLQAAE